MSSKLSNEYKYAKPATKTRSPDDVSPDEIIGQARMQARTDAWFSYHNGESLDEAIRSIHARTSWIYGESIANDVVAHVVAEQYAYFEATDEPKDLP